MAPGTVTAWGVASSIFAMPRSRYQAVSAAAGAGPEPL